MSRKFLQTVVRRALEIAGAVLMAILCFMVFLLILKLIFPSGTPLSELMIGGESEEEEVAGVRPRTRPGEQLEPFAASIGSYHNTVRSKRSADVAWSDVREGMLLYNKDAVQTAKQSSALISFDATNSLEMSSNSLLIIRSLTRDPVRNDRKSVLLVVDGELRGRLSGSPQETVQVEMALPAGMVRVQSRKSPDGKADFTVRVNPDKSSTIAVRHGLAEVTAQGRTVRVGPDLFTTVGLTGPPTKPRELPTAPVAVSPTDNVSFAYRELPPKVRFLWQGPAAIKGFRFQLATDPEFKKLVVDEQVGPAGFSHGSLRQGAYYWRVTSLDGWSEGGTSPVSRFRLVQDREPPRLQVDFAPAQPGDRYYFLTGTTEAGAELFVNTKPVPVDGSGAFSQTLQLQRGINVITVEAVDAAGNITYKTHRVMGKF
ncbi:MAG TPA: hypothetical protein VI389_01795 [Geobacteraceae bacterium]